MRYHLTINGYGQKNGLMVTYLLTFIPQSRDAIASKNNLILRILERFRGQLNKQSLKNSL